MVAACLVEMFAKDWQTWTAAKLCEWGCLFGSRLFKFKVQLANPSSVPTKVNGFSVGLCQLTLTTYVSELAPVQLRGGLLIVYSFW
jgi:hypothetical protein